MARTKEHIAKYKSDWYYKNKERHLKRFKDYYITNKTRLDKINMDYYMKNKISIKKNTRNRDLKKLYGITLNDFNKMIETQDHKCKMCFSSFLNTDSKNICVDHCHCCGKIRGIIHRKCNIVLGLANDKISILQGAIDYLKPHNELCFEEKLESTDDDIDQELFE